MKSKNKKAFTLIELLVVVLIIGILAAIALPQYQKTVWKSRAAALQQYVKTIYSAQERYKLLTGDYSPSFDKLDVSFDMPLSASAQISNDDIIMRISHLADPRFTEAYQIFVLFKNGKYEESGFVIFSFNGNEMDFGSAGNIKNGVLYCTEKQTVSTGLCTDMMGIKSPKKTAWNIRYYELP
jgi:prepilin-type N-terminal cleavage/methylation domain-containing protein